MYKRSLITKSFKFWYSLLQWQFQRIYVISYHINNTFMKNEFLHLKPWFGNCMKGEKNVNQHMTEMKLNVFIWCMIVATSKILSSLLLASVILYKLGLSPRKERKCFVYITIQILQNHGHHTKYLFNHFYRNMGH